MNKKSTSLKIQSYLKLNEGILPKGISSGAVLKGTMLAALPCVLWSNQASAQILGDNDINESSSHCDVAPCGPLRLLSVRVDDGFNGSGQHSGFTLRTSSQSTFQNNVDFRFAVNADSIFIDAPAGVKMVGGGTYPDRLAEGAPVNSGNVAAGFNSGPGGNRFWLTFNNGSGGNWVGAVNTTEAGYLGFEFNIGGNTHYGFVELEVTDDDNDNNNGNKSLNLVALGYEQTPNTPINTVLPVEFKTFEITPEKDRFFLNWQTAQEIDNAGFEVQRSTDQRNFQTISFVEGKGTTDEVQNYTLTDTDVKTGQEYYYRLRQVDFNGSFRYSKIITSKLDADGFSVGEFYPNPTTSKQVSIDLNVQENAPVSLELFDAQGKQVNIQTVDAVYGSNTINLDLSDIAQGIYFAKITQASKSEYRKIVVE